MENKNTPIYPIADLNNHPSLLFGLTKREYFIGLVMQGLLSNPSLSESFCGNNFLPVPEMIAKESISIADELLKQLEQ